MANRLTKIYTKSGDKGETRLGTGTTVAKTDLRIECIGTVDELNSHLGVLIEELLHIEQPIHTLHRIQNDLFDLGGELAMPGHALVSADKTDWLEQELDAINADLPPLENFILPGGSKASALSHVCRAVCRRAERRLVELSQRDTVPAPSLTYLNRLSDLFFVFSRFLAIQHGGKEILWQPSHEQTNH